MMMNRRKFCAGSLAAVTAGAALPGTAAEAAPPNLRVGILSDVHVTAVSNAQWFEKALRYFDAQKVDAVLITGDLTTWNKLEEFEAVAATWFKVFPGDTRSDGARVDRLFLTGNHDVDGWAYGGARFKSREEAEPTSFFFQREAFWKRLFHEDYKPVMVKEVKGYTFILQNWMSILGTEQKGRGIPDEVSPLPEVVAGLDARLRARKPFFYAQHWQIADTVNSSWLLRGQRFNNGQDNGLARRVLEAYPNCMAFTGHSHYSLTDETSIWQGEFTCVNCSCARGYAFTNPGRENGFACPDFGRTPPFEMDKFDHGSVRQGMVMDVFDDRIVLARREFTHDQTLGSDWVVPLFDGATVPPSGTPKYDVKARAAAAKAPVFAADARVTVREVKDGLRRTAAGTGGLDKACPHAQVVVEFPPVTTKGSPSRAFEFGVRAEARLADLVWTAAEKRVFSPNAYQAESRDTVPCECRFAKDTLPTKTELRFVVTPYDSFGNAGAPVASPWKKLA